VTTVVRSCTVLIRLIRLLDLRFNRVVISPHYGNGTNDGMPAARRNKNRPRTHERIDERNEDELKEDMNAIKKRPRAHIRYATPSLVTNTRDNIKFYRLHSKITPIFPKVSILPHIIR
jgi:hypothetical protein